MLLQTITEIVPVNIPAFIPPPVVFFQIKLNRIAGPNAAPSPAQAKSINSLKSVLIRTPARIAKYVINTILILLYNNSLFCVIVTFFLKK